MAETAVTPLGDGRYQVEADGVRRLAYGVRVGRTVWVFVDGAVVVVEPERASAAAPLADDVSLAAPMPARVLSVSVQPGQSVTRGDVLVTLEAMKMELPVRAPRDGTVKRVSCQTGRMVNAGDRLVELD